MAGIAAAGAVGCVALLSLALMPGASEPVSRALLLAALFCFGGCLGAIWAEKRSR